MAAEEDIRVAVMMVGGRRCGKTSVLAAMKENFQDNFAGTNLTARFGDTGTLIILEEKREEINEYFRDNRTFMPDSNPTEEIMVYSFIVGIEGKKGGIRIDFIDYPGEWLTDKGHLPQLLECMKESESIIIAIDTPHMMEEDGRFNEYRNFCHRTSEILKMALEESAVKRKLVLFVPLKCERYDKKMEEVCKKTKESYEELIRYFKRKKQAYEVAITPIFTLGKAVFSHFERDRKTGEIKVNSQFHTPENAIYCFLDLSVKKPSPRYCDQPLVYLLVYFLQLAGDVKKDNYDKNSFWGKAWIYLQESFFRYSSADDYYELKETLMGRLKKTGEGYHILQNPIGL